MLSSSSPIFKLICKLVLSKLILSNAHAPTLAVVINLAWKIFLGPWFENHYFPSSFCITILVGDNLLRQGSRITIFNVMIFLKSQCSHSLTLVDGDLDVDALSLFAQTGKVQIDL